MPSWSQYHCSQTSEARLTPVQLFAIDLLHTELRLRRCELVDHIDADYDGDGNFVSSMIPTLLEVLQDIDATPTLSHPPAWSSLKVRCYWLVAGIFLWRGKLSSNVSESRQAEGEGLRFVELALEILSEGDRFVVETPNLTSPKRSGLHWRELSVASLSSFRNEIRASSVLLVTQEKFFEATSRMEGPEDKILDESDRESLSKIGETMLARYSDTADDQSLSKHIELVEDFLLVHGQALLSPEFVANSALFTEWFDDLFPTGLVDTEGVLLGRNKCILTILVVCLQTRPNREGDLVLLLHRLLKVIVDLSKDARERLEQLPRRALSDDMSDDDFSDMDDEASASYDDKSKTSDDVRLRQYCRLARLLADKVHTLVFDEIEETAKLEFLHSTLCQSLIRCLLNVCVLSLGRSDLEEQGRETASFALFSTLRSLAIYAIEFCADDEAAQVLTRIYFQGLARIVDSQRRVLCNVYDAVSDRSHRQLLAKRWADMIGVACCDAGLLLSENLATSREGGFARSALFEDVEAPESVTTHLVLLCNNLLWLWDKVSTGRETSSSSTGADKTRQSEVTLDRNTRERLRIPVGAAIVGLCGAAVQAGQVVPRELKTSSGVAENPVSLVEFYDSDASAMEWLSDDDEDPSKSHGGREDLLRVIAQAVRCVSHVFGTIDETEMVTYSDFEGYSTRHGPALPLIGTRVLNAFADRLLDDFFVARTGTDKSMALWLDYPFGTRATGSLLDSLLYKAYKGLHGFTLSHSSDGRESSTSDSSQTNSNLPESPAAAGRLYRCIMRAYAQGRKAPPKSALDTVLAALPPVQESEKARMIRKYLFSTDPQYLDLKGVRSLVSNGHNWDAYFSGLSDWDWKIIRDNDRSSTPDEADVVRRGVLNLIAQGPLPQYQDGGSENDERTASAHTEDELSRKFTAVLDHLCHGNTTDFEEWCKAAQCLLVKADLVADRLGLTKGFCRVKDYIVGERPRLAEIGCRLADVIAEQERESHLRDEGWTQTLGSSLSHYVEHSWSSFESLRDCAERVGHHYSSQSAQKGDGEAFEAQVWEDIQVLYSKNDYVGWQQAWGGIFVSSLRIAAYRCLGLALCVLGRREGTSAETILKSEIAESFGVTLYSELMGGQVYGYPMHAMTKYRRRELAEASLACFEHAIEIATRPEETKTDDETTRMMWDLHFMVGKVSALFS